MKRAFKLSIKQLSKTIFVPDAMVGFVDESKGFRRESILSEMCGFIQLILLPASQSSTSTF